MFALLNSSKEKTILKILLLDKNPTAAKIFFMIPLVHISKSMDEFRQLSI